MAAVSLVPADLAPFAVIDEAKAQAMIDDVLARAARVAPCILDDTLSDGNAAAAKAVLRDVVLRKNESGSGAVQSQTVGPFGVTLDNRQPSKTLFWPTDIAELQSICADHNEVVDNTSGAFEVDTMPATAGVYGVDYWWTGPDSTSTVF